MQIGPTTKVAGDEDTGSTPISLNKNAGQMSPIGTDMANQPKHVSGGCKGTQ